MGLPKYQVTSYLRLLFNMVFECAVQHSIGLYTAGSDSSVTCNFDDDSAILIRWETPSGSVITENPILALTANDSIHNTQFVCHGYNTSGSLVEELLFKVIVNGELEHFQVIQYTLFKHYFIHNIILHSSRQHSSCNFDQYSTSCPGYGVFCHLSCRNHCKLRRIPFFTNG